MSTSTTTRTRAAVAVEKGGRGDWVQSCALYVEWDEEEMREVRRALDMGFAGNTLLEITFEAHESATFLRHLPPTWGDADEIEETFAMIQDVDFVDIHQAPTEDDLKGVTVKTYRARMHATHDGVRWSAREANGGPVESATLDWFRVTGQA